ncbi:MAG: hypothetical protein ACP5GF_12795 [Thiomonas sp.]
MAGAFLYPYTVSVQRMTAGFSTAEGYTQTLSTIYTGLQASISIKRDKGYSKPPGYPDASVVPTPMPLIEIMIAPGLAMGAIDNGDLITDQNGMQYRTDYALWLPMGYNLYCSTYLPTA